MTCQLKLKSSQTEQVKNEVQNNFHGLCLDCMDATRGDVHKDYWEHDMREKWDASCRIKHGQATWYFSFMGRREDMKRHSDVKRRHQNEMNEAEKRKLRAERDAMVASL